MEDSSKKVIDTPQDWSKMKFSEEMQPVSQEPIVPPVVPLVTPPEVPPVVPLVVPPVTPPVFPTGELNPIWNKLSEKIEGFQIPEKVIKKEFGEGEDELEVLLATLAVIFASLKPEFAPAYICIFVGN